jgi:putative ABC transport system substrate-binding protein
MTAGISGAFLRRRDFITLVSGAAVAWPRMAWAQRSTPPVIGFLGFGAASASVNRVEALREGLRELGYVEGKTINIEFRWAETADELRERAAELVRMNVDVIFATSSTEVGAAKEVTKTIPIVFATHADPVGTGHVTSLPRPGGNITGMSGDAVRPHRQGARDPEGSGSAGHEVRRVLEFHGRLGSPHVSVG